MGPITLFDKSFLQSLNIQEAVWFDQYSLANVCPMFFAETLADLSKEGRRGRTAAEEVAIIAEKFPEMGGVPCAYHVDLIYADLIGYSVPMTGQVPVSEGEMVAVDGQPAARAPLSAVADAFSRWSKGEFFAVEDRHARLWRDGLARANLGQAAGMLRSVGVESPDCSSLAEAHATASEFVAKLNRASREMDGALDWLGIPVGARPRIYEVWGNSPHESFQSFAPYAAFVLKVDAFFRLALASSLISADRPSNHVDIAYLYYLPFCMVFVSHDKLHKRCAEFFLRLNQDFVWGQDLKAAFAWVNDYFGELPEAEKWKGVMVLGETLPPGAPALLQHLWDRHLPAWREVEPPSDQSPRARDPMKQVEKIKRAKPLRAEPASFDPSAITAIAIERRIRRRRGGWHQLPHDTP